MLHTTSFPRWPVHGLEHDEATGQRLAASGPAHEAGRVVLPQALALDLTAADGPALAASRA